MERAPREQLTCPLKVIGVQLRNEHNQPFKLHDVIATRYNLYISTMPTNVSTYVPFEFCFILFIHLNVLFVMYN